MSWGLDITTRRRKDGFHIRGMSIAKTVVTIGMELGTRRQIRGWFRNPRPRRARWNWSLRRGEIRIQMALGNFGRRWNVKDSARPSAGQKDHEKSFGGRPRRLAIACRTTGAAVALR